MLKDKATRHLASSGDAAEERAGVTGQEGSSARWFKWSLSIFGPGMFCCLADTDAGCLITAGQSGAKWGYTLLPLQVLLIPVLFAAQELTIRLAVHTGMGHTACIRKHFGPIAAWVSTVFLLVECIGAIISEMSGLMAIAQLWGGPGHGSTIIAAAAIVFVVCWFNYEQIEILGVTLGLFELTFVFSMLYLHPNPREVVAGAFKFSDEHGFLMLVASNVGAVIMPWMIYFQQSAVVARGIRQGDEAAEERAQTLIGSCLTQLVMIGTLVTMAAAGPNRDIETVEAFVDALAPVMGHISAKILVSCAFVGGSLCAAFIVAITPAWAVCEALGLDESSSLDHPLAEAPLFYGSFMAIVLLGVVVLLSGVNSIQLNLYIELMNGLLLPMALGFLYVLATSVLPSEARLDGAYKMVLGVTFSVVMVVSLACGFYGLSHTMLDAL